MRYPDDVLAPGEELLVHVHPHWKRLVGPVLVLLLTAGVVGFLAAVVRDQSWHLLGWLVLGVLGLVVVARWTVWRALVWQATHLAITDRRVLTREGVVSRVRRDVPVHAVTAVSLRHGLLDRVLRTGTLVVDSAPHERLELAAVPQVGHVHRVLHDEVWDDE